MKMLRGSKGFSSDIAGKNVGGDGGMEVPVGECEGVFVCL